MLSNKNEKGPKERQIFATSVLHGLLLHFILPPTCVRAHSFPFIHSCPMKAGDAGWILWHSASLLTLLIPEDFKNVQSLTIKQQKIKIRQVSNIAPRIFRVFLHGAENDVPFADLVISGLWAF